MGHICICRKNGKIVFIFRVVQQQSSGKRQAAHNDFGKDERAKSQETRGRKKEGDDEKLGSFLWSGAAMTQACTLAVVHAGTRDNPGHGWRHL